MVEELKCHTGRRSEPSLLRVAKRWIKANRLSSPCTNWCCGINPQGQELGRVEAADATVKGSAGEMTKWRKCQTPRTKLSSCVMWVCFDITAPERLKRCPLVSPACGDLLLSCLSSPSSLCLCASLHSRCWWVWCCDPAVQFRVYLHQHGGLVHMQQEDNMQPGLSCQSRWVQMYRWDSSLHE